MKLDREYKRVYLNTQRVFKFQRKITKMSTETSQTVAQSITVHPTPPGNTHGSEYQFHFPGTEVQVPAPPLKQLPVTPFPGVLIPCSGLFGHMYTQDIPCVHSGAHK